MPEVIMDNENVVAYQDVIETAHVEEDSVVNHKLTHIVIPSCVQVSNSCVPVESDDATMESEITEHIQSSKAVEKDVSNGDNYIIDFSGKSARVMGPLTVAASVYDDHLVAKSSMANQFLGNGIVPSKEEDKGGTLSHISLVTSIIVPDTLELYSESYSASLAICNRVVAGAPTLTSIAVTYDVSAVVDVIFSTVTSNTINYLCENKGPPYSLAAEKFASSYDKIMYLSANDYENQNAVDVHKVLTLYRDVHKEGVVWDHASVMTLQGNVSDKVIVWESARVIMSFTELTLHGAPIHSTSHLVSRAHCQDSISEYFLDNTAITESAQEGVIEAITSTQTMCPQITSSIPYKQQWDAKHSELQQHNILSSAAAIIEHIPMVTPRAKDFECNVHYIISNPLYSEYVHARQKSDG